LETEAKRHGISLNAEMVVLLESALYQSQIESQIGRTVFGSDSKYALFSVLGQVIHGIENLEGKKWEDDFRNILRTAVEIVIRFWENGAVFVVAGEYPGGIRDAIDVAVVERMLKPFINAFPREDLEAVRASLLPSSQQGQEAIRKIVEETAGAYEKAVETLAQAQEDRRQAQQVLADADAKLRRAEAMMTDINVRKAMLDDREQRMASGASARGGIGPASKENADN
jgi:hypothetical protein